MVKMEWEILSSKVRGALHLKNDTPCQDAILYHHFMEQGLICAVADGHGSRLCPYSQDGSRLAVETAVGLIEDMAYYNDAAAVHALLKQIGAVSLPQQLEKQWKEAVLQYHLQQERPVEGGLGKKQEQSIIRQYGTTLMLLVVTDAFLYAAQIGDGDMLCVDDAGGVQHVIEPDPTYGVETRSLCERKAWRAFKTVCCPITEDFKGRLFLMSTDGYANSFISQQDFLKVGQDYLQLLREEDHQEIEKMLPIWLEEASKEGSGDDMTLALILRRGQER